MHVLCFAPNVFPKESCCAAAVASGGVRTGVAWTLGAALTIAALGLTV